MMRLALLAVLAWPLTAQTPQPIAVGQSITGELTDSDPTLGDNSHFDMFLLSGEPGVRVRILLTSSAFDTWLTVGNPSDTGFVTIATNDDYDPPGTNSRLDVVMPASGTLHVRVNSFGAGETGAYNLAVSLAPDAAVGGVRSLGVATGASSTFSDDEAYTRGGGSPAHFWRFDAEAGARYAIIMTSTDVDTYLSVGHGGPEDFASLEDNDDVDGGTDSRIIYTAEVSGPVMLRASTFGTGTGAYRIAIQRLMAR